MPKKRGKLDPTRVEPTGTDEIQLCKVECEVCGHIWTGKYPIGPIELPCGNQSCRTVLLRYPKPVAEFSGGSDA